jgi:hypothetical protein
MDPEGLSYFMTLAREDTQETSDLAMAGIGSGSILSPCTWNDSLEN